MNKNKKNLLLIIAILLFCINIQLYYFLGEKFSLISEAKAQQSHMHDVSDIYSFKTKVKRIIEDCIVIGGRQISC